jgi:hypothetical protein
LFERISTAEIEFVGSSYAAKVVSVRFLCSSFHLCFVQLCWSALDEKDFASLIITLKKQDVSIHPLGLRRIVS